MEVRYTVGVNEYKRMTTDELREAFLVDLYKEGELNLLYCEVDRGIIGAVVPTGKPLKLEAGKELASEYFCERREAGVLNIGGPGTVSVDGTPYEVGPLDALYIGRGSKEIEFASTDPKKTARFQLNSYPAHQEYPTTLIKKADANTLHLGSAEDANERSIHQYIHADGVKSCQLVMGYTTLAPGSVWNTMPCHTHERRTEIYLYFNLDEEHRVFHFMGPGSETRHLTVANEQAIISPMWSIHSGCGTSHYNFVWSMGGENQRFDDMDFIAIKDLK
jgi:4-deoxy-L-threo-5-hexosulose-uronate ketol-isomerase